MVLDSRREIQKVISMPNTITPVRMRVDKADCSASGRLPTLPEAIPPKVKNMVIIAIRVGNAPPAKGQGRTGFCVF